MSWREGKSFDSIVTDPPTDRPWNELEKVDVEGYGGVLVCESVDQKFQPMILAAPDLLREAKALLALMEDRVTAGQENDAPGEQSEEDCIFSRYDFAGLRAAVAKAEGEVAGC